MSRRTIGLLLMAFGTPRNHEQIEPFLTHIRHGAKPSERLVDCVRKLRESKSRLYMEDEHPFIVGRYFGLKDGLTQFA